MAVRPPPLIAYVPSTLLWMAGVVKDTDPVVAAANVSPATKPVTDPDNTGFGVLAGRSAGSAR